MGLKLTTGYEIKDMGIIIPEAYAKISFVEIDNNGIANATIDIQQTREDVLTKTSLDRICIQKAINKQEPIYSQLYIAAKKDYFSDWEDDIIETIENN